MKYATIIPVVLTALLLCGVYQETGIWTTLFAFFVAVRTRLPWIVTVKQGVDK